MLAAYSGVFSRILRNLTTEMAAKFVLTIDLNELKPRVDQEFLRLCLDFMYSGKVLVTSHSDVSRIYEVISKH